MTSDASSAADPASASWLEDLVAQALEVLDREGEEGLDAFLQRHPRHRAQVLALVAPFRDTGLLARDARDKIPERLGEFRLLERLGAGGMGVVFLAEQESLARTVALKIIRPDLVFFAGTRERFRREIEVIARLAHPAIVPIVATGEHDGMPWYAMQHIVGCTVDEAVKRLRRREPKGLVGADLEQVIRHVGEAPSQLDRSLFAHSYWQACVRLMRQAALGLEHAHRQGIVHRDVKPSNVMLTADGRAMLLDFGLARVHGDAKLTRTGGEPGSPAYMAPEQVRGGTADERADVYSLATTLFQLLDLEPPFASDDAEQLRQQILRGKLGGLKNAAVPPELRLVLAAAMDVDRDRRYATAADFAADLAAVLERRPIAARPLPVHVRVVRWLQRHRAASTVLGALLLLAVVLPAVLWWQQGRSLAEVRIEQQRTAASRDRALAAIKSYLTRFASSDLASLPGGARIGADLLEQAVQLLDSMAGEIDPLVLKQHRTHANRWLVNSLWLRGRVDAARDLGLAVLRDWQGVALPTPSMALLVASVRCELLRLAADGIEVGDVEQLLAPIDGELALAAQDAVFGREVAELRIDLAMNRAALAARAGDGDVAERVLAKALADFGAAAIQGGAIDMLATLLNRHGDVLRDRGRLDEAERQFERVGELLRPPGDPALGEPWAMRLRGYALWGLGRVSFLREQWQPARARLLDAKTQMERYVAAFPDHGDGRVTFASVLTELAQVERQCGAGDGEVTARLERARGLFAGAPAELAADSRSRAAAAVNLTVLSEQHWRAYDAAGMAAVARDLAKLMPDDAERQSMAAWRLLQAATLFDAADDEDAAKACDDDALRTLQACDAAGWFAPVRLGEGPTARLAGRAEFEALRAKHPPGQASRQRPR